jgi:hypothetical protein
MGKVRQHCEILLAANSLSKQRVVWGREKVSVACDPKLMLELVRRGAPARTLPTEARQTQLVQHVGCQSDFTEPQWDCLRTAAESVYAMEQRLEADTNCQLPRKVPHKSEADQNDGQDDRNADGEQSGALSICV